MSGLRWTESQVSLLEKNYKDMDMDQLVRLIGRDKRSIYYKAYVMGLRRDKAYLQGLGLRLKKTGKSHRFRKGHTPWNKGMKGLTIGGLETQFKSGHEPWNTKNDGAITMRNDRNGVPQLLIRIAKGKWEYLARHIWREHHGEIAPGMVIRHKNGNSLDCDIENLECITRAENMRRNMIHHYPDEIISSIKKIGKLKRILTKKEEKWQRLV